ncbi:RecX family transcriptional regulator [Gudongella sp. DL1XJH-153]|uniref:RecX family transcriptional regulator n=1 Tax=Gudongella sp. DL1XJH-153 TaxID=3409804 RepID=UPI003BB4A00F
MIITNITSQKDPERVNIFIDNEFAFGLFYSTKEELGLKKGLEIDEETIDKIKVRDELQSAKSKAYHYLSFRQRTQKELEDYLFKKEFSEDTIENVIQSLSQAGYIEDLDFARIYVRDKTTFKKFGPYRIKNELLQKGVSKELIDLALEEEYHEEIQELVDLVKTKYSSIIQDKSEKRFRRIGGYLQRKGHSFETIRKVLDSIDGKDD